MAQTDHCQDVETVTTEGFDGLFQGGSTAEPGQNQGGSTAEPGLTLKEAVEFYKISEKSVRIRISQGKISAVKVPGNNGPEWRIYPNGLPDREPGRNQGGTTPEPDGNQAGSTVEPEEAVELDHEVDSSSTDVVTDVEVSAAGTTEVTESPTEKMLEIIRQQAEKLEAANYRIGYLEAQSENYRQQVKLLTDSQRESRKNWWSDVWHWFMGSKGG